MKKMIFSLAVAAMFAACSSKSNQAESTTSFQAQTTNADTAGLAEYQSWKQQKEQLQPIDMNGVGSTNSGLQSSAPVAASESPKTHTRVIYRDRVARAPKEIRNQQPEEPVSKPLYTTPRPAEPTREAVSRNDAGVGAGGRDTVGTGNANGTVVVSEPVETPAKKGGWSKAAKGTAIGAASGAVLGAIISKNKGLGAVIGGVAGGLGGYAIGRSKDKKDGRYLVVNTD